MMTLSKQSTIKGLAIFAIWLFHLSAMIGITIGHFEWFVTKTPLHLIVLMVTLVIAFPIDSKRKALITSTFFLTGMFLEWTGVKYGFLFGEYSYGSNLGFKVDGVPLLIGSNWAILTLTTAVMAAKWFKNIWIRIIMGSTMMVFLDLLIEVVAPEFDFWSFTLPAVPLRNYLTWFVIAMGFHYIFIVSKIKGDFVFCLNLFLAQLAFFGYFFWIYH